MAWEIGSYSFAFDPLSADDMERLEAAEKAKNETYARLGGTDSAAKNIRAGCAAKNIRAGCAAIRAFFDELFGAGTSAKLFEGVGDTYTAYLPVVDSFSNYTKQLEAEQAKTVEKYQPKKTSTKKK